MTHFQTPLRWWLSWREKAKLNSSTSSLLWVKMETVQISRSKHRNLHSNVSHDKTCQCLEKQLHQLPCEVRVYKSLVLSTLLYGCESWTLTAETEWRIQSFENKCYRRMLHISYRETQTTDYVRQLVATPAREQEPLLSTVNWPGMVTSQGILPCQRPSYRGH